MVGSPGDGVLWGETRDNGIGTQGKMGLVVPVTRGLRHKAFGAQGIRGLVGQVTGPLGHRGRLIRWVK